MSKYAGRYEAAMWQDSEQHQAAALAAYGRGDRATGDAEAAQSLDALRLAGRIGAHQYNPPGAVALRALREEWAAEREDWESEAGL